jgi:hypothetical protein
MAVGDWRWCVLEARNVPAVLFSSVTLWALQLFRWPVAPPELRRCAAGAAMTGGGIEDGLGVGSAQGVSARRQIWRSAARGVAAVLRHASPYKTAWNCTAQEKEKDRSAVPFRGALLRAHRPMSYY